MCDRDQVQRSSQALDNRKSGRAAAVGSVQVQTHGVSTPTRQLDNRELPQSFGSILSPAQPIEDFVRDAVARAASYNIPLVDVELLRELNCLPLRLRNFDVECTASSGEDGFNLLDVQPLRIAFAAEWVDQDLDALLLLRFSISTVEQLLNPGLRIVATALVDRIV